MYVFKIPAPTPNHIAILITQCMKLPWLIALILSTLWIIYRVVLVFQKPTEELEEILGIDIPPVPDVALAQITSDSVLLYLKPPENYHSPLTHSIQVNGITVGDLERSDANIRVTKLQPGNYYGIRALATNQAGNSSHSSLIQIQTIPQGGYQAGKILAATDHAHMKKNSQSRRISQPLPSDSHAVSTTDDRDRKDESDETISKLTEALNHLRQQHDEAEAQASDEAAEAEAVKTAQSQKRDELKQDCEKSEKTCQELRKKVVELEKKCKTAQRKKSGKERILISKKDERRKMKDEIVRWGLETQETYEGANQWRIQKDTLEKDHEQQMDNVQKLMEENQSNCTQMEEELRELGIKVKELDEQRAKADAEKYAAEAKIQKQKEQEEQAAEAKMQELQYQVSEWWKFIMNLKTQRDVEFDKVLTLIRFKDQNPEMFAPVPGIDYAPPAFHQSRRPRSNVSRNNNLSFQTFSNPISGTNTFDAVSGSSSSLSTAFPHFGLPAHGSPAPSGQLRMTQQQYDNLTAGAPMSPSANTLLPSDLLGDDDDIRSGFARDLPESALRNEGSNSRPGSFRPPSDDPKNQDPQSPLSINSKSPSLLSSPHESLSNIQSIYGREPNDDDERSLRHDSSPFSMMRAPNPGSSRKISNLFSWNRQRESQQPSLTDLPQLGTLKQGQSQSFPLNMDQDDENSADTRRKGSNIWSNHVSGLWNRNANAQPGSSNISNHLPGKTRRGIFGSKLDSSEGLGESSSRPSSIYSFGEGLGQQSDLSASPWDASDSSRPRVGHGAPDWPVAPIGPWAHTQSRRASLQHGSTSNLSLGSTPLDPNEDHSSIYALKKPNPPAPIGTERFRIGQRSNTPKLNPNAPSFTARLFSRGESKKTPQSEKFQDASPENGKGKEVESPHDLDVYSKSSSPSMSRKSQDTHSFMTSDSLAESHESLEPYNSATPSEPALTPNTSAPKETLMQRLTRKSSSTKFWAKDRGSKASSKGAPSTPGEADEDAGDYLGRSVDSATSTPQDRAVRGSLSWSRVMGKTKKKGEPAPSETSEMTSEAEGENRQEEEDDV